MQLFSRKKTLIALSLGASFALGACGDDVTVPVAPDPAVVISITPPSATMNILETLNFAVQISGGSKTTPPTLTTCASSNTAVATAAVASGACRVAAVSAGNVTVTATASTGGQASAFVTVTPAAAAISNLTTSPTIANIAVGSKITIVPNVARASSLVIPTYAYATSNVAIASVLPSGEVTAVAPGTATITVTATGSATGFTTTSLTAGVTINVSLAPPAITTLTVQPASLTIALGSTAQISASAAQPAGAAPAVISYGSSVLAVATVHPTTGLVTSVAPGTAVITVTATSISNASFSAATVTQLVPVTVTPAAQVIINSLTDNGAVIDITNVAGQFEVNLQLAPNGQIVRSVQTFVCDQGEAQAACIARGPAAQQTFGEAGGQAGPIQLYINSAEFTPPNFTTGADANTLFKNGLKTMVATVTTTPANAAGASNNLSQINFNNQDGWTIQWTQPTNRANDAAGITWYGGPSTPDALVTGSTSGTGSFTVVPVIYTPLRTIATAFLGMNNGLTCSGTNSLTGGAGNILATARPFTATYGTNARSTTNFNCSVNASGTSGYVPSVVSSVDNNNAAGPFASGGDTGPAAATSIFTPINAAALGNPAFAGRYRQSLTFRPTTIYIPGDYLAPAVSVLDVKQGGTSVETGWTNAAYAFDLRTSTGAQSAYVIADAHVGLFPTATRNTVFDVCAVPSSISTTAATLCSPAVASGGLSATVGSMGLPENATNFTNQAYFVIARETDRLGNRSTTNPYTYITATPTTFTATPGATGSINPQSFGVDLIAPALVAIPNSGVGANPNYARTDVDSIYATVASALNVAGNLAADNAVFGVRFTDNRSGFPICTVTNCPAANTALARGGNYQIVRRTAPTTPSVTNDAVLQSLVAGTSAANTTTLNAINAAAGTFSGDPAVREFYVNIAGDATRNSTVPAISPAIGFAQPGYYTMTGTLFDRAGNTTTLTQRSMAVDIASPQITGLAVPPTLIGGTQVAFGPTGVDGLEVVAGDLALDYPHMGRLNSGAGVTQAVSIRFRRVTNFSQTAVLGLWHNPFASVTDNKLATPIGAGTSLYDANPGLKVPVGFIQQLSVVMAGNAPLPPAPGAGGLGTFADLKPNQVTAWLYDVRGTSTTIFTDQGRSAASLQPIAGAQVPTATSKDWTNAVGGTGLVTWAAFTTTGSTIEFRGTTSSSITNPPFTRVSIVRLAGATWEYLGEAVYAGPLDQGGSRFWRYTFSFAGQNQGQFNMAALATGDVVRAIGVDASGNGLSTQNAAFGNPPVFTSETVTLSAPAPASLTDAAANFVATVGASANPLGAALAFNCTSSNSALIAATIVGSTCTLDPVGASIGTQPITVTFSVTGTLAGYTTTTITSSVVINRIP